ncbi:hypothetical protein C5167_007880 [Papaver somniferum]|nr:hypothetical protein C5167_007880 [Papaver somniferum]
MCKTRSWRWKRCPPKKATIEMEFKKIEVCGPVNFDMVMVHTVMYFRFV